MIPKYNSPPKWIAKKNSQSVYKIFNVFESRHVKLGGCKIGRLESS